MSDREFVAEIVVRKVGDKFEAQWNGKVEVMESSDTAPNALRNLAFALEEPGGLSEIPNTPEFCGKVKGQS